MGKNDKYYYCYECPARLLKGDRNNWSFFMDKDGNLHSLCEKCAEVKTQKIKHKYNRSKRYQEKINEGESA